MKYADLLVLNCYDSRAQILIYHVSRETMDDSEIMFHMRHKIIQDMFHVKQRI